MPRRLVSALLLGPALALALELVGGCANSGFGGFGGANSDSGKKSTATDTDTEVGDEPAEVAGAFLCGPAGEHVSPEGQVSYGCAVRRQDTDEKVQGEPTDAKARLTVGTEAALDLGTVIAPVESQWHFFFSVPSTALSKELTLEVSLKINGQPFAAKLDELEGQFEIQIGVDTDGAVCNCPGDGTGTALTPAARVLFVTEAVYKPGLTLSGVSGTSTLALTTFAITADEACAKAAAGSDIAAVKALSFSALISGGGRNVKEMLKDQTWDIQTVLGVKIGVAQDMIDDGTTGPILTENGDLLPTTDHAWTGMNQDGGADSASDNCTDWTVRSNEQTGESGLPSVVGTKWFNDGATNLDCEAEYGYANVPTHIYCLSASLP